MTLRAETSHARSAAGSHPAEEACTLHTVTPSAAPIAPSQLAWQTASHIDENKDQKKEIRERPGNVPLARPHAPGIGAVRINGVASQFTDANQHPPRPPSSLHSLPSASCSDVPSSSTTNIVCVCSPGWLTEGPPPPTSFVGTRRRRPSTAVCPLPFRLLRWRGWPPISCSEGVTSQHAHTRTAIYEKTKE